eukprot:TRINITY_DN10224_c0_g1_i2.p1 TRINITY_DN10224_c0_g1~~TRINITY_DN10224_c0_g1_i2.p1  ORF type:complete len:231 (-),score=32.18 TRINITY_DN10224_c0_g1_i2:30-722(-)
MTATTIKFSFKKDTRRVTLSGEIDIARLNKLVSDSFEMEIGTFVIKYLDDEEDLLTLSNELEMEEMLRIYKAKGGIMRIHIQLRSGKKKRVISRDTKESVSAKLKEQESIHRWASLKLNSGVPPESILPTMLQELANPDKATTTPDFVANACSSCKTIEERRTCVRCRKDHNEELMANISLHTHSMSRLVAMGFNDLPKNAALLKKFDGDFVQVVECLTGETDTVKDSKK